MTSRSSSRGSKLSGFQKGFLLASSEKGSKNKKKKTKPPPPPARPASVPEPVGMLPSPPQPPISQPLITTTPTTTILEGRTSNTKSTPPQRKPQTTSQDLLGLEGPQTPKKTASNTSLWVLDADDGTDENDSSSKMPKGPLSHTSKPLITILGNDEGNQDETRSPPPTEPVVVAPRISILGESTTVAPPKEQAPWMEERSTTHKLLETVPRPVAEPQAAPTASFRETAAHPPSHQGQRNDRSPYPPGSSILEFQQQLTRIKWGTTFGGDDHDQESSSDPSLNLPLKDWTIRHVQLAWDWILTHPLPHPLVQRLLHIHPAKTAQSMLSHLATEKERVQGLQLLLWMQDYLVKNNNVETPTHTIRMGAGALAPSGGAEEEVKVEEWATTVLEVLLAVSEQPRRTVLAQASWTTSITIVYGVCKYHHPDPKERPQRTSQDQVPQPAPTREKQGPEFSKDSSWIQPLMDKLDRLLGIQLGWQQEATKPRPERKKERKKKKHSTRTELAKTQAQIDLIRDWIRINKVCRTNGWHGQWCQHVLGFTIPPMADRGTTIEAWGSLSHIFGPPSGAPTKQLAPNALEDSLLEWMGRHGRLLDPPSQHTLLQGLLAQIRQKKGKRSPTNEDSNQSFVSQLLQVLASGQTDESLSLVMSVLNLLWADLSCLPSDLPSTSLTRLPQTIAELLDLLPSSSRNDNKINDTLDGPSQAICSLVARYILEHTERLKVVKLILSRQGIRDSTLCILLQLTKLHACWDDSKNGINETIQGGQISFYEYLDDLLLDNIPTSTYLRAQIVVLKGNIFAALETVRLCRVIPKLLHLLVHQCQNTGETSKDIESVVTLILTGLLDQYASNRKIDLLIEKVAEALVTISTSTTTKENDLCAAVCTRFGGKWRRHLLQSKTLHSASFADTISSMAMVIIERPSSVSLLSFFGAVAGKENEEDYLSHDDVPARISMATDRLLQLCTDKLQKLRETMSEDVFSRLSPLLILRRFPFKFFDIWHLVTRRENSDYLDRISGKVANELREILQHERRCEGGIGTSHRAEERRLAAEVAARCLSYGAESPDSFSKLIARQTPSAFHSLCFSSFCDLVCEFTDGKVGAISVIRRARASLFVACQSISFRIDLNNLEGEIEKEVIQLQRGCIEFFTLCLGQTLLEQCAESSKHILESAGQSQVFPNPQALTASQPNGMALISCFVVNALRFGIIRDCDNWIRETENIGCQPSLADTDISPQAKTCLWNSLILLAQRCDEYVLSRLAKSTLPWILECERSVKIANECEVDQSCNAASMQIVFVYLTRMKSLVCFESMEKTKYDYIRKIHEWAMATLQRAGTSENQRDGMERLAALKLVLAVVTLCSNHSSETLLTPCLGVDQIAKTFNVIHGLANLDPNAEVRRLSSHVLGALQIVT